MLDWIPWAVAKVISPVRDNVERPEIEVIPVIAPAVDTSQTDEFMATVELPSPSVTTPSAVNAPDKSADNPTIAPVLETVKAPFPAWISSPVPELTILIESCVELSPLVICMPP